MSNEEFYKCGNFSEAIKGDKNLFSFRIWLQVECIQVNIELIIHYLNSATYTINVCLLFQAANKEECMSKLNDEFADITTLEAGDVFIGGRYHSLLPIMQEILEGTNRFSNLLRCYIF